MPTSEVCTVLIRHQAGKPSPSAAELSERATLHLALFKKSSLIVYCFIAYFIHSCALFLNGIIPKIKDSSEPEVVNCS